MRKKTWPWIWQQVTSLAGVSLIVFPRWASKGAKKGSNSATNSQRTPFAWIVITVQIRNSNFGLSTGIGLGDEWTMVKVIKHRDLLEQLGIAKLSDVKRFQGTLVKNHRGHREIFVIETTDTRGKPVVLFLKRNLKPYKKNGLCSVFRNGHVWSISRQEWEHSMRLAKVGIKTAPLVAYGEECGILWERYSFLITEKAPGDQSLLEFLSSSNNQLLRRRVLKELALLVRRLHLSGMATPDLYCRHVFVNLSLPTPELCLIDMARLDHFRSVPKRVLARDLAALYVSAPIKILTVKERLRFLHVYSKTRVLDRDLAKLIRRRVRHLLKRRKYRRILLREN